MEIEELRYPLVFSLDLNPYNFALSCTISLRIRSYF